MRNPRALAVFVVVLSITATPCLAIGGPLLARNSSSPTTDKWRVIDGIYDFIAQLAVAKEASSLDPNGTPASTPADDPASPAPGPEGEPLPHD